MSNLPESWVECKLGEVCSKPQYGWTTKSNNKGKTKYLRTTDISNGKINWGKVPFCIDEPKDIEKYLVKANDILVSRAGSVGVSFIIDETPQDTVFASYLIRFNPLKDISSKYIHYYFNSADYWNAISENTAGIAIPNINATKLSDLNIPLAPMKEQIRIVAKLEKLLANVETSHKRLETIPLILKRFRQSVLMQAITGELTKDWRKQNPTIETTDEIIKKIKIELNALIKEGKIQKNNHNIDIDLENLPFDVPKQWIPIKARYICHHITKGTTPKSEELNIEGDIPYLKVYNIVNNEINFNYKPQFVSKEIHEKFLARSKVYTNDVLMNIVGPPLGKIAIVPEQYKEWNINQALAIFRPISVLHYSFLYLVLTYDKTISNVLPETRGTAGQSNISLEQCQNIVIPLPSLEEQQEIVKRVKELFEKADRIEERYKKAKTFTDKLTQSILNKAFKGELVSQDPSDEPASVLLERIKETK